MSTSLPMPDPPVNQSGVRVAEAAVSTAQRAYDAKPSIETAMLLDAARRRLYLARRDARQAVPDPPVNLSAVGRDDG